MTQLNEIKRMQQLAGILNESQLNEALDATPEAQKITAYLKNLKLNGEMGKGLSLDKVLAPEVNYIVSLENMASGIQAFVYFKNDAKGQELAKEIQKSYGGEYSQSFAQGKVVGVTNIGSNPTTEAQLDTNKMEKMDEMNSEWEKEIWKVLKAKFDLDPTTATIKFGPNGMSIKPVDYRVWADKFTKGRQTGGNDNNNIDAKADKIAAYFNKKYGKNLVAESLDPLDEVINNALKAAGIK